MFKIIKTELSTGIETVFEGFKTPDDASEFMKAKKFGTESDVAHEYVLEKYTSKEEMLENTVLNGGKDYLYGYTESERFLVSNNLEQICAFIMEHQMEDVKLVDLFDVTEITTSMGFIFYCQNQEFLKSSLIPVLAPMQQGLKEVPKFSRHRIKGEKILNQVRIFEFGFHSLYSFNFEEGYIDMLEEESSSYDSEEELKKDYPDSISYKEAVAIAVKNHWIESAE